MNSRSLTDWSLPPLIVSWFRKKGINELFEWQVECLCKNDVLSGGNLVYSAPTSAGKTLVADILLLKKVLEHGKKALLIEPFVALTREKASSLKSMLFNTKARVGAFGGSYYTPGGLAAVSVAVCTIEKANNFINKLINEEKLSDLGIIVVDEIHFLGDERRGHQLELLLTKVLYYNSKHDAMKHIQIVGLSATIPNLATIASWLRATLYITEYRPVPLIEKIKLGPNLYEVRSFIENPACEPLETVNQAKYAIEKDYDDLFYLCIDAIVNGHSALVFCESKRECEIMASNLSSQIQISGTKLNSDNQEHVWMSNKLRENLSAVKLRDVLSKLKKCPAGSDTELVKSLRFGIAFHHAGLTSEEREIIEDGFKGGAIKTLMATSTLSSGVNLPARKVIIRSPTMISNNSGTYQKEMLNPITYRQMIGRAGRKNIDTTGESILICRPETQELAITLIKTSLGDISSSLGHRLIASEGEPSGLKKAVLEVIANGTAITLANLNKYLQSTFWLSSSSEVLQEKTFKNAIEETIRFLIKRKFIEELKPGFYKPTRLGNAVLVSGIHPDESLELVQDLTRARQGFILTNDLHIIYQVTPSDIARTIELKDWLHYSKVWNDLDETCRSVGERVGIDDIVVGRRAQGFMSTLSDERERIYKRFWAALVINDLVSEMQLPEICQKYRMSKAVVQQAQRTVAQYAGVVSIFCEALGYANLAALVMPLESRINFSCQRDLVELIRLNITRPVARCLYDNGYKNTIALAKADKLDIEFAIRQQLHPFKKDQSFRVGSDSPFVWVPELAKNMTTLDYASHIVDTARNYVEVEYDINVDAIISTRRDLPQPSPSKRSRVDDGPGDDVDVPNFTLQYLNGKSDINKAMNEFAECLSINLNFKLNKQIQNQIGGDIKRQQLNSGPSSKLGIVQKMYFSFGEQLTVYVIDNYDGLKKVRDILPDWIKKLAPKLRERPIDLYTQDIVLTFRALYEAFEMRASILNQCFSWHGFDVAWWLINDCPNRGLNNVNSSLSLVAKTKWASQYHHFLHPNLKVQMVRLRSKDPTEFSKLKDVVKAGKTAVLKPLISEIHQELDQRNQLKAYRETEIASRLTMAHMILHGIGLDFKAIKDELALYEDLSQQMTDIAQKFYAKSTISLTDIKGVARVLYDDLDLKKHLLNHSTKTDITKDSTCSEILNILSHYHPFPKLVQDYRKIGKAFDALQAANTFARFDRELNMMRVFGKCDFWQVTGRVAMFDPNLFLINRNFSVTIPAHNNREPEIINCAPRRCFIPSPGWIFVAADYSQLELRLLANFSDDESLLEILNRSLETSDGSYDVFKTVAAQMYGKTVDEVTKENRQHAKQICYGIIYGMGDSSLSNQLGVNLEQAEAFRADFFRAFSRIKEFTEALIKDCEKSGYVESLLGRRRNIDGINSESSAVKSRARRVAVNTKIQSSASDLIKLAMRIVNEKILKDFEDRVRLVLEMHDELIYEVDPSLVSRFAGILKQTMEGLTTSEDLKVRLLVNLKKGSDWSKLEDFTP